MWKGYGYQAVVKAGRQIETVSLDVRQCFKQDSQFCNVTVYDDIYRNQSSQEIVAVRANGNLFFRGSKSERIFSSIIPFIFPAFIAFNNFQYLNLPEQIPSGLTAEQYYKLGVRYDYKDEYSKARKALKLGIAQSHSAEETEKINRYMRCYMPVNDLSKQEVDTIDKACAKSAAGRKDEAKRMLEALIADNPRCESAHRYLAEVYISQKDIKHAEDELNKAISIRPGYVRAYILLAACRQIEGDLDGVKHYAQKALECDPTNKLARTIEICPWYSHDFW